MTSTKLPTGWVLKRLTQVLTNGSGDGSTTNATEISYTDVNTILYSIFNPPLALSKRAFSEGFSLCDEEANLGGEDGHVSKRPKLNSSVPSVRTRYMNGNRLIKAKRGVGIVYDNDAHERSVVG